MQVFEMRYRRYGSRMYNRTEGRIMKSNFGFLEKAFPVLSQIGSTAEDYLYTDIQTQILV